MLLSSLSYALPVLDVAEKSNETAADAKENDISVLQGEYQNISADSSYTLTSENGIITAATDEASSYKNFLVVPLELNENRTYKISFGIRVVSHGGAKTTKVYVNPSWVFNGSGSIKTGTDGKNHVASVMTLTTSDTFTDFESEITVDSLSDRNEMYFRAYTNPVKYKNKTVTAPTYEIKDIAVYERMDVIYEAGPYCELEENAVELPATEGFYPDAAGDELVITVTDAAMPYVTKDSRRYIDSEKPWIDADGREYAAGESVNLADIGKTLVLTPNVKTDYKEYTVSFDGTGLSNCPESVKVFEGDSINLLNYDNAASSVTGKHFCGWSTDGEKENIVTEIAVTEDVTLYPYISYGYDFAYEDAYKGTSVSSAEEMKKYMGNMLGASGIADGADVYVTLGNVNLPTSKIKAVKLVFDAYSTPEAASKFTSDFASVFECMYINTGASYNADGTVKKISGTDICTSELITENGNNYLVLTVDANKSEYWNGVLKFIRIDPYTGGPDFALRRVEFVEYEEFEEKTIDISGFVKPKAGEKAFAPSELTDASGIAEAREISWTPSLLAGNVFDSDISYTASVKIYPKSGSERVFAEDVSVYAEGSIVEGEFGDDGSISFEIEFPKTDIVKKYSISFDGTGLVPESIPSNAVAFEGKTLDVTALNTAVSADSSVRFNGWSKTEGETDTLKAIESLYVDGDIMLYPILNSDLNMSCTENRKNWKFTNATGEFTEDGYMLVTQQGTMVDAMATKEGLNINSSLYNGITIYYHPEIFNSSLDVIYFCRSGEGASTERYLSGVNKGLDAESGCIKVEYSAIGAANWSGILTSIRFDFFATVGSTAVKAIVFTYPEVIDTDGITITGIQTPVAGIADKSVETVKETSGFESKFEEIKWSPALNGGRFEENTEYTATVYFSPGSNSRFDPDRNLTITFDGQTSEASIDTAGRLYASFAFDATDAYNEFSMSVSGESLINIDGKTRKFTANFEGEVPDKSVSWSVDNTELFAIDANGALTVIKNAEGTGKVKATSLYNPAVCAEIDIETVLYDFTAEISGPEVITKEGRSAEYKLVTTSEYPIYDKSAVWSVDNEEIATILDNGKLLPKADGTVVITAVSNYDPTVVCTYTVEISNQGERYLVTFNPGTDDTVTNMPEAITGRGNVSLFTEEPVREGYLFLGWAEDDESFNPVSTIQVYADTEVYAVWAKGTMWTFGNNGTQNISGVTVYDNYIEADCGPYGYYRYEQLNGLNLNPEVYNTVIVRAAYKGATYTRLYYKSKYTNEKGQSVDGGWNTNGWAQSEAQAYSVDTERSNYNQFENIVHHMSRDHVTDAPGYWKTADKITEMHIDITRTSGVGFKLQYIAAIDSRRTVWFEANTDDEVTDMPEAMEVLQGDNITVNGTPKRDGYEFAGWSKTPNANDNLKKSFTIKDDLTLYAVWNKVIVSENVTEGNTTSYELGNISNDDGEALLVKLSNKSKTNVTLTFTDENGEEQKIKVDSTATGYAVFDISGFTVFENAVLSANSVINFEKVTVCSLAYADDQKEYVPQNTGKNEDSDNRTPYGSDVPVVDVPSTTEKYEPSNDGISDADASEDATEETTANFKDVNSGRFPFIDVKKNNWFREDVDKAYRLGFVKGVTDMEYRPYENVTVAEAITLAVRLNYAYHGKTDDIGNSAEGNWYDGYVNTAIEMGIIENGQFTDYDAPALRKEFAVIMEKSVPKSYLGLINRFINIPDVPRTDEAFEAVRRLYNAGILQGSDANYNFCPDTNITRAEMAAVINRIAIPANRKRIITEEERLSRIKDFSASEITALATLINCDTEKLTYANGTARANAVTSDPIVYFNNLVSSINGAETERIRIGLKWDTSVVENPTTRGCRLFFTVTDEEGWHISRYLKGTWNGAFDENGFAEIIFECSSNEKFATRVDGLRLDPFDAKASFEIGYMIIE